MATKAELEQKIKELEERNEELVTALIKAITEKAQPAPAQPYNPWVWPYTGTPVVTWGDTTDQSTWGQSTTLTDDEH